MPVREVSQRLLQQQGLREFVNGVSEMFLDPEMILDSEMFLVLR